MELKILSFSGKTFLFNDVNSITILTKTWEITILNNHTPLLTQVKPSTMYFTYIDEYGIEQRNDFFIWNWVVETSHS